MYVFMYVYKVLLALPQKCMHANTYASILALMRRACLGHSASQSGARGADDGGRAIRPHAHRAKGVAYAEGQVPCLRLHLLHPGWRRRGTERVACPLARAAEEEGRLPTQR